MYLQSLKFRSSLPWDAERRLVDKYGYDLVKREYNTGYYFLFRKRAPKMGPEVDIGDKHKNLSITQQAELMKRCDNIVDFFEKPYDHVSAVRIRLHNMCQGLKTVAERQFVAEFIDTEFPMNGHKKVNA